MSHMIISVLTQSLTQYFEHDSIKIVKQVSKLQYQIHHVGLADFPHCFIFLPSSDRTVKIWRARGGLDSTFEAGDNADEVASN